MPPFWKSPLLIIFLIAWLFSAIYLALEGQRVMLGLALVSVTYQLILTWLTIRLTQPLPTEPVVQQPAHRRILLQLAFLFALIVLTGLSASGGRVLYLTDLLNRIFVWGDSLILNKWVDAPGLAILNPLRYFVIPFLVLLAMGARPSELGLRHGHRSWRISALWSALPLLTWLVAVPMGLLPLPVLLRRLVTNALMNGFFEEFLYRGALFTRLQLVMSAESALVLQALIFGIWHINANIIIMDGDLLSGLAFCIVNHAVTGLVYGIVFNRTRSLLAPSVAHVMTNVLGQTLI